MKPYMVYSREGGSSEGASLVFAHTVKEAKRVAWPYALSYFTDEYTDMAVEWMKDSDFLFEQANPEKLAKDIPHVIFAPVSCYSCNIWGYELNKQGYCLDCWDEVEQSKEEG